MNHKKLITFIVYCCMLTGIALMTYGQIEKNNLEKSDTIEAVDHKAKKPCSSRVG